MLGLCNFNRHSSVNIGTAIWAAWPGRQHIYKQDRGGHCLYAFAAPRQAAYTAVAMFTLLGNVLFVWWPCLCP